MLTVKTINSMEKVFPSNCIVEEELGNIMFTNEHFNFQLAIYNDGELSKLNKIKVVSGIAEYITFQTVELVPAAFCPAETDDYYLSKRENLIPDLLKPIGELGLTISAKKWKSVWVNVYCPQGIPIGNHKIIFQIISEKGEKLVETSYNLEVLGLCLPENDLKVTNWIHYDCLSQSHNVEPFSKEFYEIFDKYLRAYIDCGNNMLFVPLFTPPLDTLVGRERKTTQLVDIVKRGELYQFSWKKLKKFIDFVLDRGVKYIEFSHLFTQWGGEFCPKIIANINGREEKIFGWENKSDSSEYIDFLDAFLPALIKQLKKWKLEDRCYFHLTDEPQNEHLQSYEKCRGIVKKHLKELPIMDALSNYGFYEKGLVDIPVVSTPQYMTFLNHNVKELFAYYCSWPSNEYYSNRLLHMPLQRARILGFQLYANSAKGFLHWGFNFYNTAYSLADINPYEDTSAGGIFPSGDSFIVYPTKNDVLMTTRAEIYREAMQDYRLCKLAESYIGETETKKLISEFYIKGFNEYPRSIEKHKAIRDRLISVIIEKV